MPDLVEIPVVWLQAAACTGCAVGVLNSLSPGASRLVLSELAPGRHLSLRFIAPVMAGQGHQAIQVLKDLTVKEKGNYFLVMEGSLSTGNGLFATMGEEGGR